MLVMIVTPCSRHAGQHRLDARLEQGIVAALRIARLGLLGQRDGALGEALEHQVVEGAVARQVHGRLDAIAREARAAADPYGLHSGNTPNRTEAMVITIDARNRNGAV